MPNVNTSLLVQCYCMVLMMYVMPHSFTQLLLVHMVGCR